jgi:outer membrane protein
MKKYVPVFIALWLVLGAALSAQEKISLKEAVDLVLQNNELVQIAAESATAAEFKVKESKSLLWPQLNVSGSYTRISLFGEFQVPFGSEIYTVKFGTPNNYNMRASVMEQVFTWGRNARTIEMSKAGLDLAQDGVVLTKHMLSYQAVPLFYGTVFFREAINVLDENLKAFEKKLDIMSRRFEAGLASSFEINLIKVQISALQAQKIDFENSIAKFRTTFNSLAGREENAVFQPEAALTFVPAKHNRDDLVKEALANRVEFQQVGHQLDLGQASLGLAKTGNKPSLVASFNYEFRNGFMPDIEKIRGNWTALLSVSYPAFDGFRVSSQIAQAESSLRAVQMRKVDLERTVTAEIDNVLSDLGAGERKMEVEKTKIAQAADALRIAEERYQSGLLSATDLVDAQNMLESARLNYLQLVYNHIMSTYSLFRSCGRKI